MTATDRASPFPPTGTVTFLFTDIEGSTRLLREIGEGYSEVLAQHRRILRAAFAAHNGVEIRTEGDSFFVAFARASDALAAATDGQRGLVGGAVRVRMGLHTGEPLLTTEGYVGMVVHRAARIAAVGHGGQVLLSEAVATLVEDRLPIDVTLRDLGKVRLKDLAKPEHVYQVLHPQLQEDFPALRSLEATPNNLPQQLTRFIGRDKEMADLEALLAEARLLTLTGSGGAGKTRLSLQVAAAALEQFPDGAWFVDLAPLADPGLVPQTVATVLGLREEPGKPITRTLVDHLKAKRLLLLLDNCEHVLDACAQVADTLMGECPHVKILASSHEALGIAGEQTFRVPSLSVPDRQHAHTLQILSTYESVRLFIDRALSVRPEFEVTNQNAPALASVCCHLDGIPLAIELAAARVRTLSVEEIDSKLDARFRLLTGGSRTALPRQRTLRSLIDWSYDLLNGAEKLLLQRLSVFAGGWTLAAAEQVCPGDGVNDEDVFDLLTSLADKSLVMTEQTDGCTRYRLLETVRQYGREKQVESGCEAAIGRRHCDFYLGLAEEAESKLIGAQQAEWLQRLEDEHENLRAGLERSLVDPGSSEGLRFCGALYRFWTTRGHIAEGREWCMRVLAKAGAEERTSAHAKVRNVAGSLAYFQGDYLAARALHEASLAIQRQLDDLHGIATSLNHLGSVACSQGDFASGQALYKETVAIRRELGDQRGIGGALGNQGHAAFNQGDYVAAKVLFEECLAIMREQGHLWGVENSLWALGKVAFEQGDFPTAKAMYEESLAIGRQLRDQLGIALSLHSFGDVTYEQGDYQAAGELYKESLAIWRELRNKRGIACELEGLASVVAALGCFHRAARIWGAVERLVEETSWAQSPFDHRYTQRVAAARASLKDDAAFDRAWQDGRALTLEQAIDVALEETTVERP